jgi:hypothetical protein
MYVFTHLAVGSCVVGDMKPRQVLRETEVIVAVSNDQPNGIESELSLYFLESEVGGQVSLFLR